MFTHAQHHVKIMASGEGPSLSFGARLVEFLPLEDAITKVWSHFGFPAKSGKIIADRKSRKRVHCKFCPKILYTLEIPLTCCNIVNKKEHVYSLTQLNAFLAEHLD